MEIWKGIENFEDFEVSNNARVRHKDSGRLVHSSIDEKGNEIVFLCRGRKRDKRRVSRLVAESFVMKDISKSIVINIDGNKLKNIPENLKVIPKSKKIKILETGDIFESITDCSNHTGVSKSTISKCANYPHYKNESGYNFRFAD